MNKYLSLIFIIFIFSACEVEFPEKWEMPTWQLPLTIPLIDKTYYLSEISSGQNEIQIDTSNQTFIVSIDTTLIDSGEIVIEESYFQVPPLASISEEFLFTIPSEIFAVSESTLLVADVSISAILVKSISSDFVGVITAT